MRPFDFDTLAVKAGTQAANERLTGASTARLAMVAVGIRPVILLSKTIGMSRPEE
jgi:iron(III) transport system permease protein